MTKYCPPLSVVFVWHPADAAVTPIVEYCFSLLSRDVKKPFSRSMNLPVFFRTTSKKGVPTKLNILSKKTIIFTFMTKEVACDDYWITYLKEIPKGEKVSVIPIALDKIGLKLSYEFDNKNFIRAYDYDSSLINDYMFIAVAHEIYRYALNELFEEKALGKDNALNVFLSHAKDGKNGIKLAKALKDFIDNSSMHNFFDATDIAPGYKFDEEIVGYIKKSTLIAIHSDLYSSRYWCQREILCAKENDRPIIAVDILEEYEDRRFPFATNVPGVHVHVDGEPTKKDLLRILSSALLETVRFYYSTLLLEQYKNSSNIEADIVIRSRPPEVSEIDRIFFKDNGSIKCKYNSILYPEPPLYTEELNFLSKLGIKMNTPLTYDLCSLQGKRIGISISEPSEEELIVIGQDKNHLGQLSQDIARHFLAREAVLVYGGDLRPNGFTKFLFDEAQALQTRTQSKNIHITNYIAWPIYNNDSYDIKEWIGSNRTVAYMDQVPFPEDVKDLIPNERNNYFLPPINVENRFVWSRCLTAMRKKMIENCDIRISAGGRHFGYFGRMPGVLEEIILAISLKRPLFLLGGFGGVTASVCSFIQNGTLPEELTVDWQIHNNSGYKELLDYSLLRGVQYLDEYRSFNESLKMKTLNNGLSQEDNMRLFNTPFIDEAQSLIFKGLKSLLGRK